MEHVYFISILGIVTMALGNTSSLLGHLDPQGRFLSDHLL